MNIISNVYGTFERILRYVYPGFLFLLLLYLSQPKGFCLVNTFGGNIWFLVIAGLIIGMVVQFIQQHVWTEILNVIFKSLRWKVNEHPNNPPTPPFPPKAIPHIELMPNLCVCIRLYINFITLQHRLIRGFCLFMNCCRWLSTNYFDPQAEEIELRCRRSRDNPYDYLNFCWSRFHAVSVTAWLTIAFWCFKSKEPILSANIWHILFRISFLLLLGSIIYYMRLTRVRHSAIE